MSSFWNFLFGSILIILWIIAGVFVTQANVYLTSYRNLDLQMHRAYWFTFWAAFVTWFLIGIFILLIILSIIGVAVLFGTGVGEAGVAAEGGVVAGEGGLAAAEGVEGEAAASSRYGQAKDYLKSPENQSTISQGVSWFTIGFLIFALILVTITGILSSIAASSMVASSNYDNTVEKLTTAYKDCIIASILCLGAGGLLIIGIITYFIVGYQRERKAEAQKAVVQKEKRVELAELRQLQARSTQQRAMEQATFQQQVQQAAQQAAIQRITQNIVGVSPVQSTQPQVYKATGVPKTVAQTIPQPSQLTQSTLSTQPNQTQILKQLAAQKATEYATQQLYQQLGLVPPTK